MEIDNPETDIPACGNAVNSHRAMRIEIHAAGVLGQKMDKVVLILPDGFYGNGIPGPPFWNDRLKLKLVSRIIHGQISVENSVIEHSAVLVGQGNMIERRIAFSVRTAEIEGQNIKGSPGLKGLGPDLSQFQIRSVLSRCLHLLVYYKVPQNLFLLCISLPVAKKITAGKEKAENAAGEKSCPNAPVFGERTGGEALHSLCRQGKGE